MSATLSPEDGPGATRSEEEHLERAHHEICTALTVVGSNVELVRGELRHAGQEEAAAAVREHLAEVDLALDRLRRLAVEMRSWRASTPAPTHGYFP